MWKEGFPIGSPRWDTNPFLTSAPLHSRGSVCLAWWNQPRSHCAMKALVLTIFYSPLFTLQLWQVRPRRARNRAAHDVEGRVMQRGPAAPPAVLGFSKKALGYPGEKQATSSVTFLPVAVRSPEPSRLRWHAKKASKGPTENSPMAM